MTPCQLLDDYLDHDLTGDDLARFTAHLPGCAECRRAVGEHQRLTALLAEAGRGPGSGSRGADGPGRVPAAGGAATPVCERGSRHWPRRPSSSGSSAMCPRGLSSRRPRVAEVRPAPEPPPPQARVTFPRAADVIVVPGPTNSPNVTFLWVYPGLRTPRRAADAGGPPSERIN